MRIYFIIDFLFKTFIDAVTVCMQESTIQFSHCWANFRVLQFSRTYLDFNILIITLISVVVANVNQHPQKLIFNNCRFNVKTGLTHAKIDKNSVKLLSCPMYMSNVTNIEIQKSFFIVVENPLHQSIREQMKDDLKHFQHITIVNGKY